MLVNKAATVIISSAGIVGPDRRLSPQPALSLRYICKPTSRFQSSPFQVPGYHLSSRSLTQSTRMTSILRPLPKAPPHLTPGHPVDIHACRPLPTPPTQSTGSSDIHSLERIYSHPPPTCLSSTGMSRLSLEQRPKLRICATSPMPPRKSSLDSLTVRTPAFRGPGQTLTPVIPRWNNPGRPRPVPHNPKRFGQASSVNPVGSALVFDGRIATTELDTCELGNHGKSASGNALSLHPLTRSIRVPHPAA